MSNASKNDEKLIKDAIRFAITAALGEACSVGGYVVSKGHVEAIYQAWLKSGRIDAEIEK